MSFQEINIAITAQNRASFVFRTIANDVLVLGSAFGVFDSQVGRTVRAIFTAVRLFQSMKAILTVLTATQTAHNVSMAAGATIQTTLTSATVANTTATGIRAAVTAVAAKVQAVFNSQLAATLVMTGVGITLVIAAAAAMAYFASQTSVAADSLARYNEEARRTPRSIRRAGEEESLRNRGIEY